MTQPQANDTRNMLRRIYRVADNTVGCVTCPASRHTRMIGEFLAKGEKYHMIDEEPEHVAGSLLSTVESLYKARLEIMRLKARLGEAPEWYVPPRWAKGGDT